MQNRGIPSTPTPGKPLRPGSDTEITQRVQKPWGSEWDAVDQASLESFPASDPPARGSFHAAPSAASLNEASEQVTAEPRRLHRLFAVLAAIGAMLAWVRSLRRRAHAI